MTTDITELAQSLKAAAENAIGAHERLAAYPYGEIIDISQHEGEQIDIDITDLNEFNKEANPVNILALVEALEKAQQRIGKLEKKLTDHKRMNQEMAKAMLTPNDSDAAGMEIAALRQRIAELESRTVKLPDDEDGQAYGFGKWANRKLPATAGTMTIAYCEDAWRAAFEVFSSAAGIKVEAE
jgi:BMFP domain-containing protein YqiC